VTPTTIRVASDPAIAEWTTAGPANWAIGVSAAINAITAVVPPEKTPAEHPARSRIFRIFRDPGRQRITADRAVSDIDLGQLGVNGSARVNR
jgi:hypothetical protein